MGSAHSSKKVHCNRYLDGQGPPSLLQQVHAELNADKPSSLQPEGRMTWEVLHQELPGFPGDPTLQITFMFPEGPQMEKPFPGQQVLAYLPDNRQGRKVLKLLEKTFQKQLLFSISTNETGEDMVVHASIPLKTHPEGGATDGYPDADYLKTITKIIRDKGVK